MPGVELPLVPDRAAVQGDVRDLLRAVNAGDEPAILSKWTALSFFGIDPWQETAANPYVVLFEVLTAALWTAYGSAWPDDREIDRLAGSFLSFDDGARGLRTSGYVLSLVPKSDYSRFSRPKLVRRMTTGVLHEIVDRPTVPVRVPFTALIASVLLLSTHLLSVQPGGLDVAFGRAIELLDGSARPPEVPPPPLGSRTGSTPTDEFR